MGARAGRTGKISSKKQAKMEEGAGPFRDFLKFRETPSRRCAGDPDAPLELQEKLGRRKSKRVRSA
jgi:hypothetical protein